MKKLEELQLNLTEKHQRDQRVERGQVGLQVEGVVICQINQESHRGRNLVFRINIFLIHQNNNNSILSDKLKTLILISNE